MNTISQKQLPEVLINQYKTIRKSKKRGVYYETKEYLIEDVNAIGLSVLVTMKREK